MLQSMPSFSSPDDATWSNRLWVGLRLLRYCCCCCSCCLGRRRCMGCCWNLRLWRRCQLLCSMPSFSSPDDTTWSNHLWVGLRLLRYWCCWNLRLWWFWPGDAIWYVLGVVVVCCFLHHGGREHSHHAYVPVFPIERHHHFDVGIEDAVAP